MNNDLVTIDRRTLEHLSRYGIFEASISNSILGTIAIRRWKHQSLEEKLRLLEYADLVTGTRLPRFSKTRRRIVLVNK